MDGYLVGERSARLLTELLDARPGEGGFTAAGGGGLTAWVRVTGGAAPWWAGVVELPLGDGTWQTLGACEVKTAHQPLASGTHRYLCRRTGDAGDGTARFVAAGSSGGGGGGVSGCDPTQQNQPCGWKSQTVVTAVTCSGTSLLVTTATVKVLV